MAEREWSPLVIGGVGGSGTRVYRALAEMAGYSMLSAPWPIRAFKKAGQHDTLLMRYFYTKWVDPYLLGELSRFGKWRMRLSCRLFLWLTGPWSYGGKRWGWKNPRSAFLVPFFNEIYPSMRYIHVVRDGRDLAFHPHFTFTAHERVTSTADERSLDDHLRKAIHWARVNQMVETSGHDHLQGRYFQSRLEDLCENPREEVTRILSFLGVNDEETIERATALVATPASLGRWRAEPAGLVAGVEDVIGADLNHYGYALQTDPEAGNRLHSPER